MAIVVDAGPIIAYMDVRDPHHRRAKLLMESILAGRRGRAYITDLVAVETLTFVLRKNRRQEAAAAVLALFSGENGGAPVLTIWNSTPEGIFEALRKSVANPSAGLSPADWSMVASARSLSATAATLDAALAAQVPRADW